MTNTARMLPRGVLTSTVFGTAGAACGWLLLGVWPRLTTSYTRLDQLAALTVGAAVGAAILGAREFRQRGDVTFSAISGSLLGGVGALAGASPFLFIHAAASPRVFLLERTAAWALAAAASVLCLNAFLDPRPARGRLRESVLLAAVGGAISGVIYTLPGASDVWQAVALLWWGGSVGFALGGPELWHAAAVVEALPHRGREASLLSLREWPLYDQRTLVLGEAKLACRDGRIALYPPAGGVIADGRHIREARWLTASATVAVGRSRYRINLLRPRV